MCDKGKWCEKPNELKGKKPEDCSPGQIKKCHGNTKSHPCVTAPKGR